MELESILIMKVGYHAEELSAILRRKLLEEEKIGHCFWGYGGTLCHPSKLVQPFAKSNGPVRVLFTTTKSPFHGNSTEIADEYSEDGATWKALPLDARIVSSKYALVLSDLKAADFSIDLSEFVATTARGGVPLPQFFRFRVDKAVAQRTAARSGEAQMIQIAFTALLNPPYAIQVRRRSSV